MNKPAHWFRHRKALILSFVLTPIAVAVACKTSTNVSKVKTDSPEFGAISRIIDQGLGQYRIVFKDENEILKNNTSAVLKWHVVTGWSREAVDCNKLDKPGEKATLAVEGNEASTLIQVNPSEFGNCETDPDAAREGRKVSLHCQHTGKWDGSRLIEACLYDANNNLLSFGRGTPVKPPVDMQREAGLAGPTNALAQADASGFTPAAHTDDVLNYGQVCADRLGPLPNDWSCLDGQIIPITKDGVEVPFGQHKVDDKCDKTIYLGLGDQGQCVPYARLLRLYTKKDVETVVICRRYKMGTVGTSGALESPIGPDVPLAQDVAIVQHNIKTGETCFFQALSGFMPDQHDLPVARIPPPNEKKVPDAIVEKYKNLPEDQRPVAAEDFWIKPSGPGTDPSSDRGFQCIKCHDSDPFMHSPYVDQVGFDYKFMPAAAELFGTARTRDNLVNPGVGKHPFEGRADKMVPCSPGPKGAVKDGGVPEQLCIFNKGEGVNESKGKYSLVHQYHQRSFPNTWSVIPKSPHGGLDETCTKCHRIGSINTCAQWVPDSIGNGGIQSNEQRTNYGNGFPYSHWMPVTDPADFLAAKSKCEPDPEHPEQSKNCAAANVKTWQKQFDAGAKLLTNCCELAKDSLNKNPNLNPAFAAKCEAFPISSPPPGVGGLKGAFALQGATANIGMSGKEALVMPLTGTAQEGKIVHLLAKISLTHKSPGDIRISIQHNGQTVEIFNGDKDLLKPNKAITDFKLSIDSADFEDAFKPLLNSPAGSAWSLLINDDGPAFGGSLDKVSLEVGVN